MAKRLRSAPCGHGYWIDHLISLKHIKGQPGKEVTSIWTQSALTSDQVMVIRRWFFGSSPWEMLQVAVSKRTAPDMFSLAGSPTNRSGICPSHIAGLKHHGPLIQFSCRGPNSCKWIATPFFVTYGYLKAVVYGSLLFNPHKKSDSRLGQRRWHYLTGVVPVQLVWSQLGSISLMKCATHTAGWCLWQRDFWLAISRRKRRCQLLQAFSQWVCGFGK